VYIISVLACWNWVRISHSVNGVEEGKDIERYEVILTLFPIINVPVALYLWFGDGNSPRKDGASFSTKWLNIIFFVKTDK